MTEPSLSMASGQEMLRTPEGVGGVMGFLERLLGRFSLVGDSPFPDPAHFPWTAEVERHWPAMREELDGLFEAGLPIPGFEELSKDQLFLTSDKRWKTFFFLGYGVKFEGNIARCPRTWDALQAIPGLTSAFFSILEPGKTLAPHRGPYKGVLRYHLALLVPRPEELCSITVKGETRHWSEGKSLIFDDVYIHSAENRSDSRRVVLFVDFARPLAFPLGTINRMLLKLMSKSGYVQDAKHNYARWEKAKRG